MGKRTLVTEWLSDFLGKDFSLNHPDLVLIKPQTKEIQISQIKELIWKLSLKPFSSLLKTALIDDAHLMNQEAQTCLLKTLEEPKGNTLLVLISSQPQKLFPAIISRSQIVKFNPVKKEEIRQQLSAFGVSDEMADKISEISLGRPGLALDLARNKDSLKNIDFFDELSQAPLYFRFQYAKNLSEDIQKAKEILVLWTLYLRQKLKKAIIGRQPTSDLRKTLSFLQQTGYLISKSNVNARLALEALMLELN